MTTCFVTEIGTTPTSASTTPATPPIVTALIKKLSASMSGVYSILDSFFVEQLNKHPTSR